MASLSALPAFDTTGDWFYGSGVSETGGAVTVPITTTDVGFNAVTTYDVRNAFISIELAASVGNGGKGISFALIDATSQYQLGFYWTGGALQPYYMLAGTNTFGTTLSVSTSVYIKIAEESGTVTWSYSADGTSWTTAMTLADPFGTTYMDALYPNAYAGYTGTETASNATYSNLAVGALTPAAVSSAAFFAFFGRNTLGGAGASYTINAAPTGPSAPSDGWTVVAADAFNPAYSLSNLWYPNRNTFLNGTTYTANQDVPGFNSNEVEVFNGSQVSIPSTGGCKLTAVCINTTQSTSSYRSGAVTTSSLTGGGASPGLLFKPTSGQVICLEAVIKLPTIGGADVGYWTSNGSYEEIDYFEQQNWTGPTEGAQYPAMNIISWFGTNSGTAFSSELNLFQWDNTTPFTSPTNDGGAHRWTIEFDGNAETMSCWLDGAAFTAEDPNNGYAHVSSLGMPWPTNPLRDWQFVILSFAIRDTNVSDARPPYTLGEGDACLLSSFALYINSTANQAVSIQGGQISPGTTVA